MENKTTRGGVRLGAGRKRQDTEPRNTTIAISGTATEVATLKQKAKESGKTISRFVIETILN